MAVIGYIRVSDDEQNEDLQIDALRDAGCEKLYGDHGVCGAVVQRKGLDAVLEDLREGDTFVVWKFDRLGRSAVFLLLLADEFRQRGIHFKSATEGYDALSFEGRLNYGIRALFAEHEREVIRERTKAGMQAARRRGKHIGRPRKLEPCQIEQVRLLKQHCHTNAQIAENLGVSPRTITRTMNQKAM